MGANQPPGAGPGGPEPEGVGTRRTEPERQGFAAGRGEPGHQGPGTGSREPGHPGAGPAGPGQQPPLPGGPPAGFREPVYALTVALSAEEMEHMRRLAYYQQVDPAVIATEWIRREIRFLMSIRRDNPSARTSPAPVADRRVRPGDPGSAQPARG